MDGDMTLGLGLGITAILAAVGSVLFLIGLQESRKVQKSFSIFDETPNSTVFLFDGDTLIDSTSGGRAILSASPSGATHWARLMAHLAQRFKDVEPHLATLAETGIISLEGEDIDGGPLLLRAELRGGLTRIILTSALEPERSGLSDPVAHRALTEELGTLRKMMTQAPILAWRERANGEVIWANTRYVMTVAEDLKPGTELTWPLPRLFDPVASTQGQTGQRQKLRRSDGKVQWFDLTVSDDDGERRVYALPCDAAVMAESNLRELMQTLTKTFAHLTVGLAIFDQNRQLQMFNPALLDLTGLPPDFLSARPTVLAMLDAMRDNNMVPEPKDYRRWRKQLVDMGGPSASGIYTEVWTLAGGQTYRVVGRPHSNGSLALMFEDISTEVSRTRRYRADLELGQSVIDAMEESVAVFSETGNLVMTNQAYAALWGDDPSDSLVDVPIRSATEMWSARCAPSPIWSEVQDYVATVGDREGWSAEARLTDGRALRCRLHPLDGGATLIGFSIVQTGAKVVDGATKVKTLRA